MNGRPESAARSRKPDQKESLHQRANLNVSASRKPDQKESLHQQASLNASASRKPD